MRVLAVLALVGLLAVPSVRISSRPSVGGYVQPGNATPTNLDLDVLGSNADPGAGLGNVVILSDGLSPPPPTGGDIWFPVPPVGVDYLVGQIVLFHGASPLATPGTGRIVVTLLLAPQGGTGIHPQDVLAQYSIAGTGFEDTQSFNPPLRIPSRALYQLNADSEDAASNFPATGNFYAARLRGWQVPTGLPTSLLLFNEDPATAGA